MDNVCIIHATNALVALKEIMDSIVEKNQENSRLEKLVKFLWVINSTRILREMKHYKKWIKNNSTQFQLSGNLKPERPNCMN